MIDKDANVLLIYTGGTIGMVENAYTGALEPFNFSHLHSNVPEIKRLKFKVDTCLFDPPIDSSDVSPAKWKEIVKVIEQHYDRFDGFVILHGTDTMAYTASALGLMLQNLTKPVILTGSQLPIGKLRTDGKENLITALEIAADKFADGSGRPIVPEVCIYLQNLLMRGVRTTKVNADNFSAFNSPNYPYLAEAGVNIRYEDQFILKPDYDKPVDFHSDLDSHVTILKLFPGIREEAVRAVLSIPGLKGVVLETYGSGNAFQDKWFVDLLQEAIHQGIAIVNVTQCLYGGVQMGRYENGQHLQKVNVASGYDITTEAALAKLMILFGEGESPEQVRRLMELPLCGELTVR
ncbi:MAG TPA: L-asparaginase 1 [Porphyromonadaceae bacterium]|uniref:asparaginase n=1 Tax=Limibacterium fermenti TaxID=3229863 RepID=UPI000E8D770C|nr:L-asparaginase 1 [Porphyromonadaceae bacterium]HBK33296.1 L-asparaginase 1 [Porphyromonadaceae bacterium]HBL32339.1 L-asparaginase 1 [Porphyromonadaceae bacterium]HBX21095.1 L-asparaginase 1 [Porphyromonadaceae bacterium]HBX46251.1 L-asparaginase 1 [Porphyromonadaceae bacterium]